MKVNSGVRIDEIVNTSRLELFSLYLFFIKDPVTRHNGPSTNPIWCRRLTFLVFTQGPRVRLPVSEFIFCPAILFCVG